jgi:hypothetical protein
MKALLAMTIHAIHTNSGTAGYTPAPGPNSQPDIAKVRPPRGNHPRKPSHANRRRRRKLAHATSYGSGAIGGDGSRYGAADTWRS